MHIKPGFKLRTLMGETIIVNEGIEQVDFKKMISLNKSATLLWQAAEGREFTNDDLADTLVQTYGIDRAQALADATELTSKWIQNGLVEV